MQQQTQGGSNNAHSFVLRWVPCPPGLPLPLPQQSRYQALAHASYPTWFLLTPDDESTIPTLAIVWLQPFQWLTPKFQVVAVAIAVPIAIAVAVHFQGHVVNHASRACDPLLTDTPSSTQPSCRGKQKENYNTVCGRFIHSRRYRVRREGLQGRTTHPGHPEHEQGSHAAICKAPSNPC